MDATKEAAPAVVPERATQAGDRRARWAWVEPSVWTDRMLEALETGVKGGKWFSLIDKVYRRENLRAALRHVMEPIFEQRFAERSYGFRPRRGCKDALREVDRLLRAGYRQVVEADWKSYFDTIPWAKLMGRVEERIADGRTLELIQTFGQHLSVRRGRHERQCAKNAHCRF